VGLAAFQTGGGPSKEADPFDLLRASGALVHEAAGHFASGQGQIMAAGLVFEAKVGAGSAPLGAVWCNAPPPAPFVGDEVGEFVQ
jgi:hypothetical protein